MKLKNVFLSIFIVLFFTIFGCYKEKEAFSQDYELQEFPTELSPEEKEYYSQSYDMQRFTLDELQRFTFALDPIGEQFWDIFGKFKHEYALTDNENKLLGKWGAFKDWESAMPAFYFFPNKLFVGGTSYRYVLKIRPETEIGNMMGIWNIENGKAVVTIYGHLLRTKLNDEDYFFEYQTCEPYLVELIDIIDVDPIGYTLKAFNYLPLPNKLKAEVELLKTPMDLKLKREQAARYLSSLHLYTEIDRPEFYYGLFQYFPSMALQKLTGEDIVKSPELVLKIFKNFQWSMWTYGALSRRFPDEFPEL